MKIGDTYQLSTPTRTFTGIIESLNGSIVEVRCGQNIYTLNLHDLTMLTRLAYNYSPTASTSKIGVPHG